MGVTKRERQLRALAREYGLVLSQRRGSGHYVFLTEGGRCVTTAANTPSDHRGDKNMIAKLRRETGVQPA